MRAHCWLLPSEAVSLNLLSPRLCSSFANGLQQLSFHFQELCRHRSQILIKHTLVLNWVALKSCQLPQKNEHFGAQFRWNLTVKGNLIVFLSILWSSVSVGAVSSELHTLLTVISHGDHPGRRGVEGATCLNGLASGPGHLRAGSLGSLRCRGHWIMAKKEQQAYTWFLAKSRWQVYSQCTLNCRKGDSKSLGEGWAWSHVLSGNRRNFRMRQPWVWILALPLKGQWSHFVWERGVIPTSQGVVKSTLGYRHLVNIKIKICNK